MASYRRYASSFLSETQSDGVSFLFKGIPRSFLILLALFLVLYAGYWASVLMGASEEILQAWLYGLGFLTGIVLAVTALRMWPRLEVAVPRWFGFESEAPSLRKHHKFLAWGLGIAVVLLCTVGIAQLTFMAVMIMGLIGGIYILFRVEAVVLRRLPDLKAWFPWVWRGSGWRPFLCMFIVAVLLIVVVSVVGSTVNLNEDPVTHEVKFLPTLAVLIPSIALAVQLITLMTFSFIQLMRFVIRRRQRKDYAVVPRRSAILRVHPASTAYYLTAVNFATASFVFAYTLLLVMQAISQARSEGYTVNIDIGGSWLTGDLLDYVALASFIIAWTLLLLSLSGAASKGTRRLLNRRIFSTLSIFFLMVLFMHVIVARGDEFTISIAFRAMYLAGIFLAPVLIYVRRWKIMAHPEKNQPASPPEH